MKTFAQTLELVDDPARIAEYRRAHERIWPEVAAALRAAGIGEMHIFLHGTRLFMCFEAPDDFDPARDYQSYAQAPRTREWDALMRRFQQPAPFAAPGEWWTPLEEVFDLGWFPSDGGRSAT